MSAPAIAVLLSDEQRSALAEIYRLLSASAEKKQARGDARAERGIEHSKQGDAAPPQRPRQTTTRPSR